MYRATSDNDVIPISPQRQQDSATAAATETILQCYFSVGNMGYFSPDGEIRDQSRGVVQYSNNGIDVAVAIQNVPAHEHMAQMNFTIVSTNATNRTGKHPRSKRLKDPPKAIVLGRGLQLATLRKPAAKLLCALFSNRIIQ